MINPEIAELIKNIKKNNGVSRQEISETFDRLGAAPPQDYVDMMVEFNGAEGFLNENQYIMIDSLEDVVLRNEQFEIEETRMDFVIFGSNGGTAYYAFDTKEKPAKIIELDATCLDLEPIILLGSTFLEFLQNLNSRNDVE